MTDSSDRIATYSGSFPDLALGKASQVAESFGACHNPAIFVYLALELYCYTLPPGVWRAGTSRRRARVGGGRAGEGAGRARERERGKG